MKRTTSPRRHFTAPLLKAAAVLALSCASTVSAASVWGAVTLYTDAIGANAGFGLLPVPFVGTLGLEAGVSAPYGAARPVPYAGAVLRDVNLPLTDTDAFVGLGAELRNPVRPYAEGGLRTRLIGPVGLKAVVRGYGDGVVRAGLGAEVRF